MYRLPYFNAINMVPGEIFSVKVLNEKKLRTIVLNIVKFLLIITVLLSTLHFPDSNVQVSEDRDYRNE